MRWNGWPAQPSPDVPFQAPTTCVGGQRGGHLVSLPRRGQQAGLLGLPREVRHAVEVGEVVDATQDGKGALGGAA